MDKKETPERITKHLKRSISLNPTPSWMWGPRFMKSHQRISRRAELLLQSSTTKKRRNSSPSKGRLTSQSRPRLAETTCSNPSNLFSSSLWGEIWRESKQRISTPTKARNQIQTSCMPISLFKRGNSDTSISRVSRWEISLSSIPTPPPWTESTAESSRRSKPTASQTRKLMKRSLLMSLWSTSLKRSKNRFMWAIRFRITKLPPTIESKWSIGWSRSPTPSSVLREPIS